LVGSKHQTYQTHQTHQAFPAMLALRTLEFDQIVDRVAGQALTPLGASALAALEPDTDFDKVAQALASTAETTAYLETNALFPLRAASDLAETLSALDVHGRPLDPLPLRSLADFLDSVEQARASVRQAAGAFPILTRIVSRVTSFKTEIAAVRRAIDPSGEVLDDASPELRAIRDRLRQKRNRVRAALEQFVRGRDTSKYLQEDVITERNGRFVLMVRAEHRSNVPGIVHGSSASGASLFLEPAATVEINNDIVQLEDQEREEIHRILLELTDAFRARPGELETSVDVAIELDVLQAKSRFGSRINGVRPELVTDDRLELTAAQHPLLSVDPVPIDVVLEPPMRVLLITGPNTGGKTVAIKTAGLLALMAQSGLFVPAATARLPVFKSVFADIGDEQSISASLSTFSGHITNIVAMDRELATPALVLLDEVGTGTDPNEGGALATAIVNHFKQRGALVIATTHYDAVKSWGAAADGVMTAAFAFDPQTFAPTYRLIYGAPGRSLAIEIAQRLGMPLPVIAAARGFLSDDQKRLAAHLARVDAQARALESDRTKLRRDRRAVDDANAKLAERERVVAEREERVARRLSEKLDERVRQARRDIDDVIAQLRERSEALINTGVAGAAKAEARDAIERIIERTRSGVPSTPASGGPKGPPLQETGPAVVGARVAVGALGMEGTIIGIQGRHAEIDVRGKRLRAPVQGLRVLGGPATGGFPPGKVRVSVDLKPREGLLSELNVIGCTVDQAIDRVSKFLDDTLVTDVHEVRIVHGHGTGQLRKGLAKYLKDHPLVAKFYSAPQDQGGGGATIVELKD
jgi:DNA mismatch repair protein MutS2